MKHAPLALRLGKTCYKLPEIQTQAKRKTDAVTVRVAATAAAISFNCNQHSAEDFPQRTTFSEALLAFYSQLANRVKQWLTTER